MDGPRRGGLSLEVRPLNGLGLGGRLTLRFLLLACLALAALGWAGLGLSGRRLTLGRLLLRRGLRLAGLLLLLLSRAAPVIALTALPAAGAVTLRLSPAVGLASAPLIVLGLGAGDAGRKGCDRQDGGDQGPVHGLGVSLLWKSSVWNTQDDANNAQALHWLPRPPRL